MKAVPTSIAESEEKAVKALGELKAALKESIDRRDMDHCPSQVEPTRRRRLALLRVEEISILLER